MRLLQCDRILYSHLHKLKGICGFQFRRRKTVLSKKCHIVLCYPEIASKVPINVLGLGLDDDPKPLPSCKEVCCLCFHR